MCMAHGKGLGAHPERIPKASRRNGGRGNYKTTRKEDEMKICKHIPMKETTSHGIHDTKNSNIMHEIILRQRNSFFSI